MKELELLELSKIVKSFFILDYKHGADFYYLKVTADIINDSVLSFRIFISEQDYNYAFHWQDNNKNLLIRWDNCPHYPHLSSYPHHKHLINKIEASEEVSLSEVLKYIEESLS